MTDILLFIFVTKLIKFINAKPDINFSLSCVSVQRILVTTSSVLQSKHILKSQHHMIPLFTYINTLKHQSLNVTQHVKLRSKQLTTLCICFVYWNNTQNGMELVTPGWLIVLR